MEEIDKSIVEIFVPAIISNLLLEEKITENSSDEEIKREVFSFLDRGQLELMNVAIVIGDEFVKAVENAVCLGQKDVAIALAGICFEQITNEFYHKILLNKYELSNREYSSCMKGISIKDKLTWLYKLTTSRCMEPSIVSDIHKVCSFRNSIVHYKPKVEKVGEWGEDEDNSDEEYDISKLIPLIEKVREIFTEDMDILFSEEKTSKEIFRKIFRKN
ncbi:hypothetical protein IMSAGC003_00971 [Lachnospiraceae bacterium]|nr:hypothetical protein IMSAGC003_00971 [Lachnospiraceae bacterium]